MAIGLRTPRETLRLTVAARLVNRTGTAGHTAAVAALPLPRGLDGYVFKAKSPTCGLHGIARCRDGGQPADHRGRGAFAQRLTAAFPLLPVEDEGRLNDAVLREAFVERVFAIARLRELVSGPWRPPDLMASAHGTSCNSWHTTPAATCWQAGSLLTPAIGQRRRPQRPTGSCSGRGWPQGNPRPPHQRLAARIQPGQQAPGSGAPQ